MFAVAAVILAARVRRPGWLAAGIIPAAAALAPGYAAAWRETGSPLYPLTVKVGGHVLFAGNPQLERLFAGTPEILAAAAPFAETLGAALLPTALRLTWEDYPGLGPSLLLMFAPAVLGFSRQVMRADRRAAAIAFAALAAIPCVGILSEGFAGQRAQWGVSLARLLLTVPAALFVFAAQIDRRAMAALWGVSLVVEWVLGIPGGLTPALRQAVRAVLPAMAIAVAGAIPAVLLWRRRRRKRWAIAAAAVGLCAAGAVLGPARRANRDPIYAGLAERPPTFMMHVVRRGVAGAWPLWQALDGAEPRRIALTAGWDGVGHNVLRYPLLGSRLQNRVVYVPITRDGAIVDYERADDVARLADPDAWLARLAAEAIDVVVVLDPPPPEAAWIAQRPASFERIAGGIAGTRHAAYRFHPR
jgi:hypothetical protein